MKNLTKIIRKLSFVSILLFIIFVCSPLARAQDMNSSNFKIQSGNFNMTSGNKSSTNFKLSDVVGQTAAGVFASKGYIINAGFLNSAAGQIFSFSVSPTTVDFGALTANSPMEKSIQITIKNGDVPGYLVKANENQPLSTTAGAEIPDLACIEDTICTIIKAGKWTGNTTYGFGYRMSGRTVPQDYSNASYFRPFPASRRNELSAVIMETKARKVTDQAEMKLRLNVSPQQPVGQYRNVLTFSALAGI
ncbi:hypothetical protein COV53_04765 [Candidatus Gottesmanbacteria bacterium CG11_big_fil_rev_8_21_14_0_20_37_11]|uniref:Uncharacterized protein n=3 Tax=Candidatus Gottesmaniibacteriota TaxID=1752720 RepID=A0A2M7RRS8_9BACT|nr:MAG: hypothetical protein AUJ73_04625 [Candidatus Gottesmanbacteria bacterium CG1_02_37_22]PIP32426.1 MAG: hypothetical protein COX23_04775 [Candidatus Gottesmanbacteria bacterium CG23_combo_of_CG06-09_8_20_14_all_37_19]PIR08098.1 MAG: hypothetical protein COV53_04765 [Candidatus Gottesmanbacteria bacterium CG11_big_fil_rev_8_21_14_0_20_37_11]PIZ03027.1 MAG: hypothetical protein COY59_01655 [Candidatus Gottesmanbacteria bacterium CG_4_10_14_0_8_um_filter_37_24]